MTEEDTKLEESDQKDDEIEYVEGEEQKLEKLPKSYTRMATKSSPNNSKLNAPVGKRFSKNQVSETISKCHGLTASICAALDCTTAQLVNYLKGKPELRKLQEEARMGLIDEAEKVLMDNLKCNDPVLRQRAAEFVLSKLGQAKGWSSSSVNIGVCIDSSKQGEQIRAIFGISQDPSQNDTDSKK